LAWGLGGDKSVQGSLGGQLPLGMRVDEGPQFDAHLVGLQMWSMRTLGVRQQLTVPGQVRGQFVLRGNVVGGEVTNNTGLVLHDCVVVGASGASRPIPALEPGQTVRAAPLGQYFVNGATPHRADLDLIVAPLTLSVAAGRFALSPGDLPVSVIGTTVVPSASGPGNSLTLNSGDHMDVQLVVPTAGRHLHLDSLTVQTNLSDGASSLSPTD